MLKKLGLVLFAAALFAITAQAQSWEAYVNSGQGTPTYDSETINATNPRATGVVLYLLGKATAYGSDIAHATAIGAVSMNGGTTETYSITAEGTNGNTDIVDLTVGDFLGTQVSGYVNAHYALYPAGAALAHARLEWWY